MTNIGTLKNNIEIDNCLNEKMHNFVCYYLILGNITILLSRVLQHYYLNSFLKTKNI